MTKKILAFGLQSCDPQTLRLAEKNFFQMDLPAKTSGQLLTQAVAENWPGASHIAKYVVRNTKSPDLDLGESCDPDLRAFLETSVRFFGMENTGEMMTKWDGPETPIKRFGLAGSDRFPIEELFFVVVRVRNELTLPIAMNFQFRASDR